MVITCMATLVINLIESNSFRRVKINFNIRPPLASNAWDNYTDCQYKKAHFSVSFLVIIVYLFYFMFVTETFFSCGAEER